MEPDHVTNNDCIVRPLHQVGGLLIVQSLIIFPCNYYNWLFLFSFFFFIFLKDPQKHRSLDTYIAAVLFHSKVLSNKQQMANNTCSPPPPFLRHWTIFNLTVWARTDKLWSQTHHCRTLHTTISPSINMDSNLTRWNSLTFVKRLPGRFFFPNIVTRSQFRHETRQECRTRMEILAERHKSSHVPKMAAAISKQARHIPTRSQVNENVKLSLICPHCLVWLFLRDAGVGRAGSEHPSCSLFCRSGSLSGQLSVTLHQPCWVKLTVNSPDRLHWPDVPVHCCGWRTVASLGWQGFQQILCNEKWQPKPTWML